MTAPFFIIAISCLVAGSIFSGFLYFRQKAYTGRLLVSSLFILRALGFALLLFVLVAPLINYKQKERLNPVLAVLVDNSRSMVSSSDSGLVRNQLQNQLRDALQELDDAELRFFSFDSKLAEGEADFNGNATDMGLALQQVRNTIDPKRLRAIVVVSDGIINRGMNPLYEVENNLMPVYTIAVGDSARQRDVAVQNIRAPRFVYRGDEVLVDVTVRATNSNGEKVDVKLEQGSKQVGLKPISINNADFAGVVQFSFSSQKPGLFAYDVTIPALPGEKNARNNTQRFYIEVIENRKKIAVVAGAPHPDVAAVREALKSVDAYDVRFRELNNLDEIEDNELVILFVQPGFSEQQYGRMLQNYTGPICLFIDPEIDGRVVSNTFEGLSLVNNRRSQSVQVRLNRSFGLFKLSTETRDVLSKMPVVQVTEGEVQTMQPFETLLSSGSRKLAQYGNWNKQRFAVFNMGGIWKWRVANYRENQTHRHIDELLQATVQYLTADQNANRLRLYYEPRQVLGEPIAVRAEVYDAAFQATDEAKVNLTVEAADGTSQKFEMIAGAEGYQTTLNGLLAANYNLSALAQLGDEELTATGELLIEELALEDINLRANYSLLQQMAAASGGMFYTLDALADLPVNLKESGNTTPFERTIITSISLIDIWWLLFVAVVLLAFEWLLRRYYGRI